MKIFPTISPEEIFYELPDERIAKYSLPERDRSLLLVANKGSFSKDVFCNVSDHLEPGSMLVLNNAKVINARFIFHRGTGARIEIFLLEPVYPHNYEEMFNSKGECVWRCMIGNSKKWKFDTLKGTFCIGNKEYEILADRKESEFVRFQWDDNIPFSEVITGYGHIPLPPYLKRNAEDCDLNDYQTVFSRVPGSVAAPTAGLHFTSEMISSMKAQGFVFEELTLHVGAGTFLPVQAENVTEHKMHREKIIISRAFLENIIRHNKKVVAVGTTSVRTMESLAAIAMQIRKPGFEPAQLFYISQWETYEHSFSDRKDICSAIIEHLDKHKLDTIVAETTLMIVPGFRFLFTDALITNFHQPHSTLLLLVSAFMGNNWKGMYRFALDNEFRFLSYGDACLIK